MIIKRKLYAVYNKRAYGTKNTPDIKVWRKDIRRNIKTCENLNKFDPETSRLVDKDSVGESIRQAHLNLDNSAKEAVKKWNNELTAEDRCIIDKADKVRRSIENHYYMKKDRSKHVTRQLDLLYPNNNKMVSGKLYNGEKYNQRSGNLIGNYSIYKGDN